MNKQNFCRQMCMITMVSLLIPILLTSCITPLANPQTMAAQSAVNPQNNTEAGMEKTIIVESLYGAVTFSEMANQAAAIFVGKVTRISPAQWNQDSGEYWSDVEDRSNMAAFVFSYIEVDVVQSIVVTITLEPQIKLPVLSEIYGVDEKDNVTEEKQRSHDLAEGNQAVFFIKPTDLAWRGSARPVLSLIGRPGYSYFKLEDDGLYHGGLLEGAFTLEELIRRIEEERAKPAQ